jgi:hypothetical protein
MQDTLIAVGGGILIAVTSVLLGKLLDPLIPGWIDRWKCSRKKHTIPDDVPLWR